MEIRDLPFTETRRLTEEQRTEAVKALLAQGFSIAQVWEMAPSLLAGEPGTATLFALPTGSD